MTLVHALRSDPPPFETPHGGATEDWIARHQNGVWRFLRVLGCSYDEADDLTQETFLVALDHGVQVGPEFLRRTARHLWLHRRRDDRRRAERLAKAAERLWRRDCAADDGDGWLADLDACLAGLSPRARHALDLFYGAEFGRAELGSALGISTHGARNLLQRTRAFLRRCIRERRAS